MKATHVLESEGQALLASLKFCKAQQPLTSWRAKASIVRKLEALQGTAATYKLKSQGQALLAGLKHCKA